MCKTTPGCPAAPALLPHHQSPDASLYIKPEGAVAPAGSMGRARSGNTGKLGLVRESPSVLRDSDRLGEKGVSDMTGARGGGRSGGVSDMRGQQGEKRGMDIQVSNGGEEKGGAGRQGWSGEKDSDEGTALRGRRTWARRGSVRVCVGGAGHQPEARGHATHLLAARGWRRPAPLGSGLGPAAPPGAGGPAPARTRPGTTSLPAG